MEACRISASSYSNTAPLVWSFLYGSNHGKIEIILDNAPARSAELMSQGRVDAALVPVIAYQLIGEAKLIPGVCVGAKQRARSVCIVTREKELSEVRSVSLDTSSRTSAALTKIIFREFIGSEPEWRDSPPDIRNMLDASDAALLIGDPALVIADGQKGPDGAVMRKFDLAEVWKGHTGLGFIFAMWMTRRDSSPIDFAAARDEGLEHVDEIVANYRPEIHLAADDLKSYLTESICYSVDDSMRAGMELYFKLAARHGLIGQNRPLRFVGDH